MSSKLSPKHELFVAKITQIGAETYDNATKAYIAAGYSERGASASASALLRNPKIQAAITARTSKALSKIDFSVERTLQGIANLAFYDPREFYREDGSLKAVPELTYEAACALQGFEIDKLFEHFGKGGAKEVGTTTKIKMADRGQNLERLGRFHKLFTDKIELNTGEELVQRIRAGMKRLAK